MSLYFVNNKKGFHSDEIFSYGLSNSFYQPFIQSDNLKADAKDFKNINEWFSGDSLRNYITVQSGEQFRYDSVWYNQSQDRHPPLYYSVLHTVCSFFPEIFSPWFGFSLNMLFFVITQIFLYKLTRNILKSKYLALISCIIWGFSYAALSMVLFIRMYCMLVMWVVIFMYLHSELYSTKVKNPLKQLIPIILVTACGTLTQHLFLFPAFVTAVCFCIWYLIKKRFKLFFAYGFSVLGGVLLGWAIFPPAVSQIFTETEGVINQDFTRQFILSIKYFFMDTFGITFTEGNFILIGAYIGVVIGLIIIFGLPVVFLFRENEKVRKTLLSIKEFFKNIPSRIRNFSFKRYWKSICTTFKKSNPMTFIIFVSGLSVFAVTAYTINFIGMGYINRYLFVGYILFTFVLISLIYFIISKFKYKKIFMSVIAIFLIIMNFSCGSTKYTFDFNNKINNIIELTRDTECIIIEQNRDEDWLINTFANEIFYVDNIFLTNYDECESNIDKIDKLKTDKPVYLFLYNREIKKGESGEDDILFPSMESTIYPEKAINLTKLMEQIDNLNISGDISYITEYTIFTRKYDIYRIA